MMMNAVFCAVLILSLIAQSTPQKLSTAGDIRYQVSIQRPQTIRALLIYDHVCSGVLISTIWVLTTGSCMDENGDYRKLSVHLETKALKGGLRLKIERVENHPKYFPERIVFNFAALQLETTVGYGSNISTVVLPPPGIIMGTDCSVSGWQINTNRHLSNELFRSKIFMVDPVGLTTRCTPLFVNGQIIDFDIDHVYCAAYFESLVFPNEEGNPLICNYLLWGLLIEGGDKGGQGFMLFAKVDLIRDWLATLI